MNDLKYNPDDPVTYLNEYQAHATGSAIYPGQGTPLGIAYVGLKLNGEAGEFAEHVGKAMRDDQFHKTNDLTKERKSALIKELGDVLWYVSAAAAELNASLSEVANVNLRKLADRRDRGTLRGSGDDR